MADNQKNVTQITDIDADFAKWFTDVVVKAELISYSGAKGFFILRPYGYAIWERIQSELDSRFKATGHENVSMPLLIPESLLQKEKDHVEGFAPECAWVTFGGEEELEDRLAIRPTSETLFCDHWHDIVTSWRDLPKLYNQWCSVLRWEKTTRPFLRHREFLWQEGHTLHETADEAVAETLQMLDIYNDVAQNILAMPTVKGVKTDKEKFKGAEKTYTIECMMKDGKALQSGTSHYFGDGFARAFDITFTDKNNQKSYPYQTSWGLSTRIIGGLIMTHGDNNGLILPPRIAPVQVAVIPVAANKPGVLEAANALAASLKSAGIRVMVDASDNSPGWKFAQNEMKGIPLRLELGPRDIEAGHCIAVTRHTREKSEIALASAPEAVLALLEKIQTELYETAATRLRDNIRTAETLPEAKAIIEEKGGFVQAKWCGDLACEQEVKDTAGMSSRCIVGDTHEGVCHVCGKPAQHDVMWGVAY
jgi:prolyl-tRNA synthetase